MGKESIIKVVAAILIENDKVLIARRAAHKKMPRRWEFPGGKVEPGESETTALSREILEEFDVKIEVGGFFAQSNYDYEEFRIELRAYCARLIGGEFNLSDHDKIEWVRRENLKNFDLTEADIPFVSLLERL